ncbi:Putative CH domain superfamily protein [Septoria linicola]|uniref:CH domain superfamily protein n=1 Tax=Septoria linicola TaxID=215465 RepID=A0A9Q9AIG6_9PEZI|nr:putative CH domain superfamily protein [Septoria linicola]USW49999.1 Putative CH domain superfamily protein [Septoria linicola]
MASSDSDSLGETLLAWVRSFDDVGKVEDLGVLNDGKALWAILQDVDPDYFAGSLPEPDIEASSDWTRKWQNLKHVEKQVSIYYRDVRKDGQTTVATSNGPDLKAIAAESSMPHLQRLIMEIIRAAMSSEKCNDRMGKRLLGLGPDHAMAIAYEMRSMQEEETPESDPVSRDESAYQSEQELPEPPAPAPKETMTQKQNGGLFGDPMMEKEEELLRAQATIEKLQATYSAAQQQVQQVNQERDKLQEAFDTYRAEINDKGRPAGNDDDYTKLQRQMDNDRAYIDDLETQLQASKEAVDNYEKQIQRFKDEHEAGQNLRDDLQVLRAENEDLSQKVKANENLKKKIQALQEQEKANTSLREELKQANDRLEELDRLKHVQAGLEKEIIEKKGLIRNQEYQINELTTTRKHAEYDARVLAQKLEAARERQERDHEAIEELRNKLQEAGPEDDIDVEPSESPKPQPDETVPKRKPDTRESDQAKQWAEKLALLEQQLEASDLRLKQASQRNATLEDEGRSRDRSAEEFSKAAQQLEEREQTISDLRRELDNLQKQPNEAPPPQDLAALQRENRLMATAWYDLSSRLQNNGVSLGRRRQEPKSWIGRQRNMVGPSSSIAANRR